MGKLAAAIFRSLLRRGVLYMRRQNRRVAIIELENVNYLSDVVDREIWSESWLKIQQQSNVKLRVECVYLFIHAHSIHERIYSPYSLKIFKNRSSTIVWPYTFIWFIWSIYKNYYIGIYCIYVRIYRSIRIFYKTAAAAVNRKIFLNTQSTDLLRRLAGAHSRGNATGNAWREFLWYSSVVDWAMLFLRFYFYKLLRGWRVRL